MNEPALKLDAFLLEVYKAIEKDDSMALDTLIKNNKDLLSKAASEKHLVLEAFKKNANKCMKSILDNLEFDSKKAQVRAVEDYICERIGEISKTPNKNQLDCIQLLNINYIEDKIFERNASQIEVSEHIVYFRAFLRSKDLSPMDYLPVVKNDIEKSICLALLN